MNCRLLIGILTLGTLGPIAHAQSTFTWTQTAGGTQNWSTGGNWSGGSAPSPVAGDTVDFSTVNIAANTTLNLETDRTAGVWKFGDTTPSTAWTVSAGPSLIVSGTNPAIEVVGSTNRAALNATVTASAGLEKNGAGSLQLLGTASVIGPVTVNAGVLDLAGIPLANIGGGSGRNVSVANGAAVVKANATFTNDFLSRIVANPHEFGVFMSATGPADNNTNLDLSGLPTAFLGTWASNGAQHRYNGIITPAADNYRIGYTGHSGALHIMQAHGDVGGTPRGMIIGGGSVVLTNENTFTGDTVIRSGRLFLGRNLALQNSALNVGNGTGDGILGTICFLNSNTGGAPNAALTNAPTLGGLIGGRNLASIYNSANQNNTDRLAIANVLGLTLDVAAGKSFEYTGNARLSTGMSLTKKGDGTQILSGANDFTGPTLISDGTLELSATGSLASATVTVAAGGTLAGTGQITGSIVTTGGTISPGIGSATGTLRTAGVTLDAAAMLTITINDEGAGQFDQVVNTGTFSPNGATLVVAFNDPTFSAATSAADLASATQYSIITGVTDSTMFGNAVPMPAGDASVLGLSGPQYEITASGQRFWIRPGSISLVPLGTLVPEPGSAALAAAAGILALRRRR